MSTPTLNKQDYGNILAVLSQAKVEGIQAAAALVALFNKVQTIQQAEESDGNSNGAKSDQPGTDQPAANVDPVSPGN